MVCTGQGMQRSTSSPPEAGTQAWQRFALGACRRSQPCPHLTFGIPGSKADREHSYIVLSHPSGSGSSVLAAPGHRGSRCHELRCCWLQGSLATAAPFPWRNAMQSPLHCFIQLLAGALWGGGFMPRFSALFHQRVFPAPAFVPPPLQTGVNPSKSGTHIDVGHAGLVTRSHGGPTEPHRDNTAPILQRECLSFCHHLSGLTRASRPWSHSCQKDFKGPLSLHVHSVQDTGPTLQ